MMLQPRAVAGIVRAREDPEGGSRARGAILAGPLVEASKTEVIRSSLATGSENMGR